MTSGPVARLLARIEAQLSALDHRAGAEEAVGGGSGVLVASIERIEIEALDIQAGDRLHGVPPYPIFRVIEAPRRSGVMLELVGRPPGCPLPATTILLSVDEYVTVSRSFREGEPIHAASRHEYTDLH